MSCLIETETPGGEANYMMSRLYRWHELRQFWELGSKKWNKLTWNWRLTVPKTAKRMLVRQLMTNLSWLCCFCMQPLPSAYKSSHALLVRRGVSLWTDVYPSHPSSTPSTPHQCLASEIKQTFLSTNLAYLLAFVRWSPGPHFCVTVPTHHRWESTLFF